MLIKKLEERGLITPPSWLPTNTMYLTIWGSHAFGVADTSVKDKFADYDHMGFCIPPKNLVFPHLDGHIPGFGSENQFEKKQLWSDWIQHHVIDESARKEYDFTVHSIVKFFQMLLECNPNTIDTLFTRIEHVVHITNVGQMVRDNRQLFLSKAAWKRYRGYAQKQLHKMDSKKAEGTRQEIVDKFGYDVKFAYNIVRLLDEAEQILLEGDIDLQRSREQMKAIRRGDWKPQEVRDWYMSKEKALEAAYTSCTLPLKPDENKVRQLLTDCLEEHYGKLGAETLGQPDWAMDALRKYDELATTLRSKLF